MDRARTAPAEIRTLADLLKRLGNIPPDRIRFVPPPGTATEDDLIAAQSRRDALYELIDGTLVEKAMGFREGTVTSLLSTSVGIYLDRHDIGFGVGPNCFFRMPGGCVRSPSLAVIGWHRLPGRRIPKGEITDVVPDLVAEILRKGNTSAEIRRKVGEYFEAGVRLAWVIDPAEREATVYTTPGQAIRVQEDQPLEGVDVLPGFSVRIGDVFRHLDAL